MPTSDEIAYQYDPLAARSALAGQVEALRSAVHGLTAAELELPTRLEGWRVRELVAHLGIVLEWVPRYLDTPVPEGEPLALLAWVGVTRTAAATILAGVQEHAAESFAGPPAAVAEGFDEAADALLAVLDGPAAEPGRLIAMRFGPMLLADYLVTRLVESVVHADDLADALGRAADFPHDQRAVGLVAGLLRTAAGAGDDPLRADGLDWIRLATGRLAWADADGLPGWAQSGLGKVLPVMG
ncbi:maleylpyruvate isomerase family mycothiol-dependent enzyme [Kitasatospora sp. NPDC059571]|uniref:maleylpyruvate isomerase family mycothiol-dependent enzyme n=1 Tax=Kitasatospora sp. NPDC059571 TaxID=3346871 RepID=UPI0036B72E9C